MSTLKDFSAPPKYGILFVKGRIYMSKKATLEQWKELYELILKIDHRKPWLKYWDQDLFAIETKREEEPYFVSILGKASQCIGVATYKGIEGYSDFYQVCDEEYNLTADFVMSDQNCLTAYWGTQEYVDDESMEIIDKLGIQFRDDENWIYFKAFEKKSFPSLPNYAEVNQLIDVYKGLIFALDHDDMTNFEDGEVSYTQKDEDGDWFNYSLPRPIEPDRYYQIFIENSVIDELKELETCDMELAVDFDYTMFPVSDEGFERPINPLAFILYDLRDDAIITFDLIHPDQEDYQVILDNVIGVMHQFGLPKHIYAKNPYILNWLEYLSKQLNIELIKDDLQELDEIFDDLKQLDMLTENAED